MSWILKCHFQSQTLATFICIYKPEKRLEIKKTLLKLIQRFLVANVWGMHKPKMDNIQDSNKKCLC